MIPAEPGAGNPNHAELAVFKLIESETPASWIGLHHVGLPRHPTKPLAEIDFVVIGEPGIFCLEVKAGHVRREAGIWYAGTRELAETPFVQVGSASAALRSRVEELHPFVYGYGCVFPDCLFDKNCGPEADAAIVYDDATAKAGFSKFIERLGSYWHERYPYASRLGSKDIKAVARALRPDFESVEVVISTSAGLSKRIAELTAQQADAVERLRETKQVVVKGGTGTGKTMIAAHEAERLVAAGNKTLLTCFNKALAGFLRQSHEAEGLTVAHVDDLMSRLIADAGTHNLIPSDAPDDEVLEYHRPMAALTALDRLGQTGIFDAVVVDEGQDLLTEPRIEVLGELVSGGLASGTWRIFWDPNQALYAPDNTASLALVEKTGAHPAYCSLDVNCRNTRAIVERAEVLSGIPANEVTFAEGPEVMDRVWSDAKSQIKELRATLKDWRERGLSAESTIVLSPRKFARSVASEPLGGGIEIRDVSGGFLPCESGMVAFSTIQAFKGLEADAVVLVDIDDLNSDWLLPLLYVGATRARMVLAVLRSGATTPTLADRFASLAPAAAS